MDIDINDDVLSDYDDDEEEDFNDFIPVPSTPSNRS